MATEGKYAELLEGAEALEFKGTVPSALVPKALARFNLTKDKQQDRFIYFFDTPKLDLMRAGIITRARRTPGSEHDSTVKFRPVDPASIGKKWRKFKGFKIEADASERSLVKSASFSTPVEKGLIKEVVAGEKGIDKLFDEDQLAFVEEVGKVKIDFTKLVVLGPLEAAKWSFRDPGCPWPIVAELWRREDGAEMLELSVKAPVVHAAVVAAGFMAFLDEVGVQRDTAQQAKTRWAIDYYIDKIQKSSSRSAKK